MKGSAIMQSTLIIKQKTERFKYYIILGQQIFTFFCIMEICSFCNSSQTIFIYIYIYIYIHIYTQYVVDLRPMQLTTDQLYDHRQLTVKSGHLADHYYSESGSEGIAQLGE